MNVFPQEVNNKLSVLAQRPLEKGELFLLAKAISDELPLPPADCDSVNIYTLKFRRFIECIIYGINEFSYINEDQQKTLLKLVNDLMLWRFNTAYNPPVILFTGDNNTVIDDISSLPRYIDCVYMCAVADIIDRANWAYNTFREAACSQREKLTQGGDNGTA